MAIGIPKVPFYSPGEDNPVWISVYDRLYSDRYLLLLKELDRELANQLIGLLTYYSLKEDDPRHFILVINSLGGVISPGLAVYDMMRVSPVWTRTYGLGVVASTASFLLAAGQKPRRVAYPHTRILMHQPFQGFIEDQKKKDKEQDEDLETKRNPSIVNDFFEGMRNIYVLRTAMAEAYAEETGHSAEEMLEIINRNIIFTPIEAKEYRVIDYIPEPKDKEGGPPLKKEDRYRENNF
uniref:ATP-dependent Clp protease proteolytic subunit n=1 Tax=Thysanotus sp. Chase 2218 TaxID=1315776 RepID=A0A288W6U3_9ASPA|nr:ClpP-like protease [Thysanotus sp. Chase 2218]